MAGILYTIEAVDRSSRVFRKLGKAFSDMADEMYESLTEAIGGMTALQKYSLAAGAAIVGVLGVAVAKTARFEQQMAQSLTVVTDGGEHMASMMDMVREQSVELGVSATKSAEAIYYLGSAGLEVGDGLEEAYTPVVQLAKATNLTYAQSAELATDTMNMFGKETEDIPDILDSLARAVSSANMTFDEMRSAIQYIGPAAAAANWELEETTAVLGVLADLGLKGSRAGRSLDAALRRLQAPVGQAAVAMETLNVQIYEFEEGGQEVLDTLADMGREMQSYEEAINRTEQALFRLNVESQELSIEQSKAQLQIMKIRRQASRENRDLTETELRTIEQLEAGMEDLRIQQQKNSIASAEYNLQQDLLNHTMEQTESEMEDLSNEFSEHIDSLLPAPQLFEELALAMHDMPYDEQIQLMTQLFGQTGARVVIPILTEMMDSVEKVGNEYVVTENVIEDQIKAQQDANDVYEMLNIVLDTVSGQLSILRAELGETMYALGQELLPVTRELIKIFTLFLRPINWLIDIVPSLAIAGGALSAMLLSLKGIFTALLKPISKALGAKGMGGLVALFGKWIAVGMALGAVIWGVWEAVKWITDTFGRFDTVVVSLLGPIAYSAYIFQNLEEIISRLGDGIQRLRDLFGALYDRVLGFATGGLTTLYDSLSRVIDLLSGFRDALVSTLEGFISYLTGGWVEGLREGLVGGLTSAIDGALYRVEDFVDRAKDILNPLNWSFSPTNLVDAGESIPEQLALGVERASGALVRAEENMISDARIPFDSTYRIEGEPGRRDRGRGDEVYNINIDSVYADDPDEFIRKLKKRMNEKGYAKSGGGVIG